MPPRSKSAVASKAGVEKKKFRPNHKNLPDGPWKRKLEKEKKNLVHKLKTKKQYAKIKAQIESAKPKRALHDIDDGEMSGDDDKVKVFSEEKGFCDDKDGSEDASGAIFGKEGNEGEEEEKVLTSGSDEEDDDEMAEDDEEETPVPKKSAKSKSESTDVDADADADPNDTIYPSRKQPKGKPTHPGYFDKQLKKAEAKKRAIEEKKAAIETKKRERDEAILARQKRRQGFKKVLDGGGGRGGRGGRRGSRRQGGRGGKDDKFRADGKRKLGRESEFLLEKVKRMVGK